MVLLDVDKTVNKKNLWNCKFSGLGMQIIQKKVVILKSPKK